MKFRYIVHIIFFFLCSSQISVAQLDVISMLNGKNKKEFDFHFINGFIVVDITLNKLYPLSFILDTGASNNILFKKEISDVLGISYSDTIKIAGSDLSNHVDALVARNLCISLENAPCIRRDIIVLQENLVDFEKALGISIDGLLGGDFFRGLIVQFDFKKNKITLHDPTYFDIPDNYEKNKIRVTGFKPYVKSSILIENTNQELEFLIDTGAGLALMILADSTSTKYIPDNAIVGHIGSGIGGEIEGYMGLTQSISLFSHEINNVVSHFQIISSLDSTDINSKKDG